MKLTYMIFLTLILMKPGTSVMAQETSMRIQEQRFVEMDSTISMLNNNRNGLSQKLEEKTRQIQDVELKGGISG